MMSVIQAEYLKLKRTFTRKLVVGAPLFFAVLAVWLRFALKGSGLGDWELILSVIYNWWPMLFIPLGTALLAALVQLQEKKTGNYRNLLVHHVSPWKIWLGKVTVMALHTLLATVTLMAVTVIAGLLVAHGSIPWLKIITAGLLVWVASLALIPLQLFAAVRLGFVASMALGATGFFVGIPAASKPYWIWVPWSWPTRLMCPVVGVHPNGISLAPDDPLWDASVIPVGLVVSLFVVVLFTWLSCWWFSKREVK